MNNITLEQFIKYRKTHHGSSSPIRYASLPTNIGLFKYEDYLHLILPSKHDAEQVEETVGHYLKVYTRRHNNIVVVCDPASRQINGPSSTTFSYRFKKEVQSESNNSDFVDFLKEKLGTNFKNLYDIKIDKIIEPCRIGVEEVFNCNITVNNILAKRISNINFAYDARNFILFHLSLLDTESLPYFLFPKEIISHITTMWFGHYSAELCEYDYRILRNTVSFKNSWCWVYLNDFIMLDYMKYIKRSLADESDWSKMMTPGISREYSFRFKLLNPKKIDKTDHLLGELEQRISFDRDHYRSMKRLQNLVDHEIFFLLDKIVTLNLDGIDSSKIKKLFKNLLSYEFIRNKKRYSNLYPNHPLLRDYPSANTKLIHRIFNLAKKLNRVPYVHSILNKPAFIPPYRLNRSARKKTKALSQAFYIFDLFPLLLLAMRRDTNSCFFGMNSNLLFHLYEACTECNHYISEIQHLKKTASSNKVSLVNSRNSMFKSKPVANILAGIIKAMHKLQEKPTIALTHDGLKIQFTNSKDSTAIKPPLPKYFFSMKTIENRSQNGCCVVISNHREIVEFVNIYRAIDVADLYQEAQLDLMHLTQTVPFPEGEEDSCSLM